MRQIRLRIKEKRGVDYTEDEIRELANVKLEKFLDPRAIRSGLVEQFRRQRRAGAPPPENFGFEETTIYDSHRAPILRKIRRALNPVLKLFFNPEPDHPGAAQAVEAQRARHSPRRRSTSSS